MKYWKKLHDVNLFYPFRDVKKTYFTKLLSKDI